MAIGYRFIGGENLEIGISRAGQPMGSARAGQMAGGRMMERA